MGVIGEQTLAFGVRGCDFRYWQNGLSLAQGDGEWDTSEMSWTSLVLGLSTPPVEHENSL